MTDAERFPLSPSWPQILENRKIRKIYKYKWVPVARGNSKVFNSREPIERRDLLHKLKATVNSHDETQLDLQILSKNISS